MSEVAEFEVLMQRVRQGDADAASELVSRYERELQIMARVRLTDPALRREFDSIDVCQSILANFFIRAASGQFQLDTPDQLIKLLATMIRNKVTDIARRSRRDRRDVRRLSPTRADDLPLAQAIETPSQHVANAELLRLARHHLSESELDIVNRRRAGSDWQDIARAMDSTPEAVRKRFSRSMDRVMHKLGLDASHHD